MVRGKLSGNVTTVDHGKTFHATFADGHRKGSWISGPLITKAERVEEAPEKIERAEAATSTSTATEPANANKISPKASEDIPAQGPAEETTTEQKSEASKPVATETLEPPKLKTQSSPPLVAQNSAAEPDESTTPREPVTKKAALAPGAVRAMERPTSASVPKKAATPRAKSAETDIAKTEKASKTAKPAPSQATEAETQISKDIPAEGPPAVAAEKNQVATSGSTMEQPAKPSSKETPVDDSIRTLTGPPSSLHTSPPAEAKAPADELKAKMAKVRDGLKDKEAKLATAQDDLRKVLTVRQEAEALMAGLLKRLRGNRYASRTCLAGTRAIRQVARAMKPAISLARVPGDIGQWR